MDNSVVLQINPAAPVDAAVVVTVGDISSDDPTETLSSETDSDDLLMGPRISKPMAVLLIAFVAMMCISTVIMLIIAAVHHA